MMSNAYRDWQHDPIHELRQRLAREIRAHRKWERGFWRVVHLRAELLAEGARTDSHVE